ncbi:hypothetical protein [Hymenobacter persicinus]|uniref:DUF3298 domain-containing protein n=1 Tax=Hymenobacter persicinus TaxID=2025506 RepID=A0A4Q5LI24_9BACT|nr:hypothetical protein [Hymenobacter persicinus]RYU84318.1 hypothetical protein EWM57_01085 [Hymenobacter persicinus]
MHHRYCLLVVALLSAGGAAFGQQDPGQFRAAQLRELRQAQPLVGSYEGALGGRYPIRLQLSTRDSALTGQYYYCANGRLLDLTGRPTGEGGAVALRETAENDTVTTGRFVLRLQPDHSLTGTWYNAAGTVLLPFHLTRVPTTARVAAARVQTRTYLRTFEVPVVTVPDAGVRALLAHRFSLQSLMGEDLASLRAHAADQRESGVHYGSQELRYDVNCNERGLLSITVWEEGVGASIWHSYQSQAIDLNTGFAVDLADEIRPEQLSRFLALGQQKLRPVLEGIIAEQQELLQDEDREGLRAEQFSLASVREFKVAPNGLTFDHPTQYGMSNFLFRTLQGSFTGDFSWAELDAFLKPDSPLRRLMPR